MTTHIEGFEIGSQVLGGADLRQGSSIGQAQRRIMRACWRRECPVNRIEFAEFFCTQSPRPIGTGTTPGARLRSTKCGTVGFVDTGVDWTEVINFNRAFAERMPSDRGRRTRLTRSDAPPSDLRTPRSLGSHSGPEFAELTSIKSLRSDDVSVVYLAQLLFKFQNQALDASCGLRVEYLPRQFAVPREPQFKLCTLVFTRHACAPPILTSEHRKTFQAILSRLRVENCL
jgi:hypothetical protein